ncbi:MAG: DUF3341 domain-containing protein [Phycisphaeraceae bacterium]|nr:MAG: DUF3341 domain-containing protein [Phycisphaeraceae bacterium]
MAEPRTDAPIWGMTAEYESPAAIYHAAERFRDAGYAKWDVYAPIPIHGIDQAMGLKPSKVGWFVAVGAIVGVSGGLLMQWFMNAFAYQINVAGKPLFAWEQFMPVTFELGILFSATMALLAMLTLNGLPRWNHPLFGHDRFLRVSDDRFMIVVESKDPKFDAEATRRLLEECGGTHIETVVEE